MFSLCKFQQNWLHIIVNTTVQKMIEVPVFPTELKEMDLLTGIPAELFGHFTVTSEGIKKVHVLGWFGTQQWHGHIPE